MRRETAGLGRLRDVPNTLLSALPLGESVDRASKRLLRGATTSLSGRASWSP
ncbi:hypothetical protein [Haloglomus irregulare]|jgi:hypothetical protein|uniref:hypothetical protein n=1 Tax=Haloglomus irregulare TaxID=2234134 RepID=UPI00163D775F|nr:hypothetical protein [Haloglomus irregulare]